MAELLAELYWDDVDCGSRVCEQVKKVRTVTTNANSLLQAGIADDAFPVQGSTGTGDVLWLPEIERL